MADLAQLAVRVTSSGIEITNRELEKLGRVAGQAERQTETLGRTTSSASGIFSRFAGILSAAGVGLAARQLADYTDRMAKMQGQLALVTRDHVELNQVYDRALKLANDTGQSLEATVNLYAKLARSTQELGLSQDQLFTITQAINQAFVVSGATATEAAAAMHQLSQGLASGTLRGEELNSVMENSPRIAMALADGLGVSIGELRRMGAEGELTAEKVTGALELMAGQIDAEFQQMPMTIGRATQQIKNNLLDAFGAADSGPVIQEVQALADALAEPTMKKNLADFASMLIDAAAGAVKLAGKLSELKNWLMDVTGTRWVIDLIFPSPAELIEAARNLGLFKDELDRLGEAATGQNIAEIKNQIAALKAEIAEGGGTRGSLYQAQAELKALEVELRQAEAASNGLSKAAQDNKGRLDAARVSINKTTEELIRFIAKQDKLTDAEREQIKQRDAARKALERQKAGLKDFIGDMEFEVKISRESAREQEILTAQRRFSTVATDGQNDAIRRLVGTLYDQEDAMRRLKSANELIDQAGVELEEWSQKASENAMKPWNDALQGMAESIDSGFTQAWRDAFTGAEDGFKNFANNIWDSFLNLLANMAHLAITRPIAIQMGTAMGGIIPGTASAGVTPGSIASGGLSSITSGITAAGKGLYSAIGTLTNDLGLFKISNAANAKMAATTGWTMAGDFAGGLAGKFAADKVFGETSGIGSTLGGVAGSIFGPPVIGAAIGSFVGGAIEKGLGKVFGYGGNNNDGKNIARAEFDFATGTFGKGAGSGNSWKKGEGKEQADFIDQLMTPLSEFGKAIGGSNLKGGISADSRGNLTFNGKAFSDASELLAYGFKEIVSASDKVSDRLKPLVMGFSGSAEEIAAFATGLVALDTQVGGISDSLLFLIQNASGTAAEIIQFSNAIVSISQQASVNTVTNAIKEFNAVAPSAAVAYHDHTAELLEQIEAFDGSAASASTLNDMLIENKTAAYEFAMAIQEIGAQLDTAAANQAKDIRESVLSADELRAKNIRDRDRLAALLPTLTDPAEINRVVRDILDLNAKVFKSLPENERKARSEEFATYAEGINTTAQGLLGGIVTGLESTQTDINTATMAMLDGVAEKYRQSADTQQSAADKNLQAAQLQLQAAQISAGEPVSFDGGEEISV